MKWIVAVIIMVLGALLAKHFIFDIGVSYFAGASLGIIMGFILTCLEYENKNKK